MAKKGASDSAPRQHSVVWLQGLLCGALAALATPTAVLLGALLAPALLAMMLDREPGKPTGRCVALFAMAASVDPLKSLWLAGHSMATAAALLSNLDVLGAAWIAAAAGWLLAQLVPIAVRTALETVSIARSARLRSERARLVEAWGLDKTADQ